jgi:hypothetical protein
VTSGVLRAPTKGLSDAILRERYRVDLELDFERRLQLLGDDGRINANHLLPAYNYSTHFTLCVAADLAAGPIVRVLPAQVGVLCWVGTKAGLGWEKSS